MSLRSFWLYDWPKTFELEAAFVDYARGDAVNRPRSHTYTDLGGGRHYLLKTMDGSLPRLGVHALRVTSDLTHEHAPEGRRRRDKSKLSCKPRGKGRMTGCSPTASRICRHDSCAAFPRS